MAIGSGPTAEHITRAAEIIRRGGVVCFPTETTYGLAVAIDSAAGIERLNDLKGRGPDAPYGLIVPDEAAARALVEAWPAQAHRLARQHWPGPLTLVVTARQGLPPRIVGPSGGVGVRVSSHSWSAALATAAGGPITATSANPTGAPPARTVAQARSYFGERVGLYLDAGESEGAIPSTVVEVAQDGTVRILRRGAIRLPGA